MKLLAFDTSTDACSVALLIDDEIRLDHRVAAQQQSRLLLPMIDAMMADAGLRPTDLDGLVYGRGPGSFTGVRIAIAAAQGIAFGADIGVYGVSTLHCIAQGCHREFADRAIHVAVDARMSEVYCASFGQAKSFDGVSEVRPLGEELIGSPEKLLLLDDTDACESLVVGDSAAVGEIALAGSGYDAYLKDRQLSGSRRQYRPHRLPSADDCLNLAREPFHSGLFGSAETATPVYLRNQVAQTEAERAQRVPSSS